MRLRSEEKTGQRGLGVVAGEDAAVLVADSGLGMEGRRDLQWRRRDVVSKKQRLEAKFQDAQ